jgi:hypothetical protein
MTTSRFSTYLICIAVPVAVQLLVAIVLAVGLDDPDSHIQLQQLNTRIEQRVKTAGDRRRGEKRGTGSR